MMHGMQRARSAIAFVPLTVASWYGMQAVHELGHVLGAWVTGGTVQRVVLHPLQISRTDISPNPRPLFTVWAGPIVGVMSPLAMSGVFRLAKWPYARVVYFFAGFCLIANGAYIGVGSFDGVGDAGEMLRCGSPQRVLILFGVLSFCAGLGLWHVITKRG